MGVVAARLGAISDVVAQAAAGDRQIAELAAELDGQRRVVARWMVEALRDRGRLRAGLDVDDAADTTWVLLDPAVHRRLTRDRGWSTDSFTAWLADSLARLLLGPLEQSGSVEPSPSRPPRPARSRRMIGE